MTEEQAIAEGVGEKVYFIYLYVNFLFSLGGVIRVEGRWNVGEVSGIGRHDVQFIKNLINTKLCLTKRINELNTVNATGL